MRLTFGQLQITTKDLISQANGSFAVSSIADFVKQFINHRYVEITQELREYITFGEPVVASTVSGQQFYHKPPDTSQMHSMTLLMGGVNYPLKPVHSQYEWDRLNQIDFSGSTIPQWFFERRYDFGIYPTPQNNGDTITATGTFTPAEMIFDDYVTGTVNVTQNNIQIVGVATTFTSTFVNRFFRAEGDSRWYKIATYVSSTQLNLQTYYEGNSQNAVAYIIGQSPEVPEELHKYIPFGAAADFYAPRKDMTTAQSMNNYFYTGDFNNSSRKPSEARGGLLAAKARYSTRGNTALISRKRTSVSRFDERFSTTLTSTI